MKDNVKSTVRNILSNYLEQNTLRKTPERFAILDAVYSMDGHFTLDELGEKLNDEEGTVFRGLQNMRRAMTTTATATRYVRCVAR